MIGTCCVLATFPFTLLPPIGLNANVDQLPATVYYSVIFIVFNLGWATAQTAHLAMIPEMSKSSENNQVTLTSIRNAATAISNMLAYLVAWIFFRIGK